MAKKDVSIIVNVVDQATKKFQSIGGAAESMIGRIQGIAAGAGIAGLAGAALNETIKWGNAVDDLADITGATGEEASKLLSISKYMGQGIESAAGSFAKFGKAVSNAKDEMKKYGADSNDMFSRLGMTINDLEGQSLDQVFYKVVERMREMKDGADKDRVAMELFGRSGYEMHDMLNMSAEQMDKVIGKARDMGLIFDTETAAKTEQLKREIDDLSGSTSKLSIGIGRELVSAVGDQVKALQSASDWVMKLDEDTRKWVADIILMGAELGIAAVAINTVAVALEAMGLKAAAAAGPWVLLATAIGMATAALIKHNSEAVKDIAEVQYDEQTGEVSYIKKATVGMGDLRGSTERASAAEIAAIRGNQARSLRDEIGRGGGGGGVSTEREAGKIASINRSLNDELHRLTMDRFNYEKWAVGEWAKEQEAAGADRILLTETVTAKLVDIETRKNKEQERLDKETADKVAREQQRILWDKENITDEIMRLSLDEKDYAIWCLNEQKRKWEELYAGNKEMINLFGTYYKEKMNEINDVGKEMADRVSGSIENSLVSMLNGTKSFGEGMKDIFRSIVDEILREWARLFVKNNITPLLSNLFGSMFGGGPSAATGSSYNIMQGGGFFNLSPAHRAAGGPVSPGHLYMINENEQEFFVPSVPGSIKTPAQMGNIPKVVVNVINKSGEQLKVDRQETKFDGENYVIDVIANAVYTNKGGFRDILAGAVSRG